MMFSKVMHVALGPLAFLLFISTSAAAAYAQSAAPTSRSPDRDRVFLSIGGGTRTRTPGFSENRSAPLHAEQAMFETRYGGKSGTAFGGGGGAYVWRGIWLGAAFSSTNHRHDAVASGQLPHPFRFNDARTFEGTRGGLRREETAMHLQVMYRIRIASRLRVGIFAGPSWISAQQDLVDQTMYSEDYPYDSANFAGTTVVNSSKKATAFGVGANVSIELFGPLSAGIEVRHAAADVDFETPAGRKVRSTVGGTQALVGVHVGF